MSSCCQPVFGLLGHPLGHSLSPQLHSALAGISGCPMEYQLYDLPLLDGRAEALLSAPAFYGLNVTIPYKQAILPFLDALDESARRYGAVNTVARARGGLTGYNTDCVGFERSIADFGTVRSSVVLGAGGAGRMFAILLARRGASVTLGVRPTSAARGRALAGDIASRFGTEARALLMDELERDGAAEEYDLLVNATPCGMFPRAEGCPAGEGLIRRCRHVFDSIYNPARTVLAETARRLGIPVAGGMRMLAYQGAAAQEIWFGARFSDAQIEGVERRLNGLLASSGRPQPVNVNGKGEKSS